MTIEFRVKRVERFIVTKYEQQNSGLIGSSRQIGKEFDNFDIAYEVAHALAKAEQERLGLAPGDTGVIFPSQSLEDARGADSYRVDWYDRPAVSPVEEWSADDLVSGRVYESRNFGPVTYMGLDHYCGDTTHKFDTGLRDVRRDQYVKMDRLGEFLAPKAGKA
ncbi:hypothetical protein J2X76_003675 [Neorhizobium sp. 2083]|uniref:hypothetical protein n=1 Tax=Neorhizobium sp. 2083 TaxID=2817762 RepID=UPI0028551CF3|nr:hypothetical protein [Neorhizobium sp. 2083]MDR6818498.1 hypothetical protein [Neorhizobium sp. 2083]